MEINLLLGSVIIEKSIVSIVDTLNNLKIKWITCDVRFT